MAKEQITPQVVIDGNDIYVVFKNASKDLQNQIKEMFSTKIIREMKTLIPIEDDTEDVIANTKNAVFKNQETSEKKAENVNHSEEVSAMEDNNNSGHLEPSDIIKMTKNEAFLWLSNHVSSEVTLTPLFLRSLLVAFQTSKGSIDGATAAIKLSDKAVMEGFEKNKMMTKIKTFLKSNDEFANGISEAGEEFSREETVGIDWD